MPTDVGPGLVPDSWGEAGLNEAAGAYAVAGLRWRWPSKGPGVLRPGLRRSPPRYAVRAFPRRWRTSPMAPAAPSAAPKAAFGDRLMAGTPMSKPQR